MLKLSLKDRRNLTDPIKQKPFTDGISRFMSSHRGLHDILLFLHTNIPPLNTCTYMRESLIHYQILVCIQILQREGLRLIWTLDFPLSLHNIVVILYRLFIVETMPQ